METKEVKTIEILSDEQIAKFPKKVKEDIVFLSENMNSKELIVLNPIASKILEIKEAADNLELVPPDENGFDKENIALYKEVKKEIRSFNGDLGRSAKKMKAPYQQINKGIIGLEKAFKSLSDEIADDIKTKFDAYEKEEEKKAKEREEKKNAAFNEQIDQAKAEAEEQRLKNAKSTVYNEIKFNRIMDKITNKTNQALIDYNENSLLSLREEIDNQTFEGVSSHPDFNLLDEELLFDVKQAFTTARKNALALIDGKLQQYQVERDNLVLSNKNSSPNMEEAQKVIDSQIPPLVPPPPGSVPKYEEFNDVEFVNQIVSECTLIHDKVKLRVDSQEMSSPHVYTLLEHLKKITEIKL